MPARSTTPPAAVPTITLDGPLLCLDVSSTAAGWAAFRPTGDPFDFGVIRPRQRSPSWERIDRIVAEVLALHDRILPAAALMEFSNGHTHGRLRKASGLAVLGQAQGAVRQALASRHCPVAVVGEGWTRGEPKGARARRIALLVPRWRAEDDVGLDSADALGIGFGYFDRAREAELIARAGGGIR